MTNLFCRFLSQNSNSKHQCSLILQIVLIARLLIAKFRKQSKTSYHRILQHLFLIIAIYEFIEILTTEQSYVLILLKSFELDPQNRRIKTSRPKLCFYHKANQGSKPVGQNYVFTIRMKYYDKANNQRAEIMISLKNIILIVKH